MSPVPRLLWIWMTNAVALRLLRLAYWIDRHNPGPPPILPDITCADPTESARGPYCHPSGADPA